MRRRTFLGKTAAGIAIHLLPIPLVARSLTSVRTTSYLSTSGVRAANALANGLIGKVSKVMLTHTYSPEHTDFSTLRAMAERDIVLTNQVSGLSIPFSETAFFTNSASSRFGSFSADFQAGDVHVLWQALARIGSPFSPPAHSLRLFGATGIFQTTHEGYQALNLNGQPILSDTQTLFPDFDLSTLS